MANILTVTGGATSLIPTTSWSAPNGLFPTTDRNDGSLYGWSSSTSTLTLPASAEGDGYLIAWGYELTDTSAGRSMIAGRVIQSSGTGTFASAVAGGYTRDSDNNQAYAAGWAFVDNPSASAEFQFQFTRDTDTPTGGTSRSFLQVVPFSYSDIGIYTSTSNTMPGGTTPAQMTGFTGTDGTNITIASDTVTVAGANKRYLALGSVSTELNASIRSQRWCGFREDGVKDDSAKSCMYLRNGTNDKSGTSFVGLYETGASSKTLDIFCYLGDGTAAGEGGAGNAATTTATSGAHAMVIIELNDSAEVLHSEDSTAEQAMTTANTDITISYASDIAFNDSTSFTRSSDTAVNIVQNMDALLIANVGHARETVTSSTRWEGEASFTVSGTTQTPVGIHGNFNRGAQGGAGTFGSSYNSVAAYAVTSSDTVGYRHVRNSTTEDVTTQPGWVGFSAINLDTLTDTGGNTVTATMTGTGTTALSTQVSRASSFSHSGIGTASFASQTARGRAFSMTGTGASAFSRQTSSLRSLAMTGTGAPTQASQVSRAQSQSMTGTGTSAMSRQAALARSFSASGVGSSALSTIADRFRAFVFSGTGAAAHTADTAGSHSATMTGTGASDLGTQSTIARSLAASGTGTSTVGTQSDRLRSFSTTGSGSPAFSRQAALSRSFSASGTGTSLLSRALQTFRSFTHSGVGTAAGEQDFGTTEEGSMTGTGTASGSQVYSPGSGVTEVLRRVIRTGFAWVNKWF